MSDDSSSRLIVVLDTNVLVQAIPSHGRFRPIIEAFNAGRFTLVVSSEILLEYEEILTRLGGPRTWPALQVLLAARESFVRRVNPTYFWRAITHDRDDNKFVDAAIAGNAGWIVTQDSHFDVLIKQTELSIRPIHPTSFIERFLQS